MALKSAARRVWRAAYRAGGVKIRITQPDFTVEVKAVPGENRFEVETEEGQYQSFEDRDFLVLGESLISEEGGEQVLPVHGARVELLDKDGEVIGTYSASHRLGERHYRWSDTYHTVLRIHTVESAV